MFFHLLTVFFLCVGIAEPYRPVVLIHGLFGDINTWMSTTEHLHQEFPGINITISHKYFGEKSVLTDLWTQVEGTYEELKQTLTAEGEGVTLICYSQGGILCRGMLEKYSDINVHTFISLSGPLAGQYGLTHNLTKYIPPKKRAEVYKIAYTSSFQKKISIANYWNDPYHQDLFLEKCIFLPKLNNCTECYKNFVKIKQVVLIGGPDDGVITPWQSSQFGFYAENSGIDVIDVNNTKIYLKNIFGLRTLYEKGNIATHTVPGVKHEEWTERKVFDGYIKQWIK